MGRIGQFYLDSRCSGGFEELIMDQEYGVADKTVAFVIVFGRVIYWSIYCGDLYKIYSFHSPILCLKFNNNYTGWVIKK